MSDFKHRSLYYLFFHNFSHQYKLFFHIFHQFTFCLASVWSRPITQTDGVNILVRLSFCSKSTLFCVLKFHHLNIKPNSNIRAEEDVADLFALCVLKRNRFVHHIQFICTQLQHTTMLKSSTSS